MAQVQGESFLGGTTEKTTIEYKNLSLVLMQRKQKSAKVILDTLSGVVRSGRLTALMGPSGSGKTSLLNVLAGRTKKIKGLSLSGEILVNGDPVQNWSAYRRKCAYVEQDDLLFHTLTVRETIQLAADLRLPRTMSVEERRQRADLIIGELGLRKCEDTRIGNESTRGISGGERKRVSIAIEILRGPSVLFLDECTTGLDSFQALRVATTIKELAQGGRTIVSSIHQPRSSIFALFDDVVILSEGKMVYNGPAAEMVGYFSKIGYAMPENYNPADFVLDLVSVDMRSEELETETRARLSDIVNRFEAMPIPDDSKPNSDDVTATSSNSDNDLPKKYKYETGWYRQFSLLYQRATRQKLRDKTGLMIPLFSTLFFATLLGCLYFKTGENLTQQAIQDKVGALFFLSLSQYMTGMFSILNVFPQEKFIVNRERSSKAYSLSPFFLSRVVADLPMLFFPWLMCTIVYFLAAFKMDVGAYFETAIMCMLAYETAASFGLLVGAFAPSLLVAQAMAMPIMLIFILFSGFYANNAIIPAALNWIQWISPIRWLFAAIINIQLGGVVFECNTGPQNCVPTGDAYINRLGIAGDSFGRSLGVLLGMIAFLQFLAYFTLRVRRVKWVTPTKAT